MNVLETLVHVKRNRLTCPVFEYGDNLLALISSHTYTEDIDFDACFFYKFAGAFIAGVSPREAVILPRVNLTLSVPVHYMPIKWRVNTIPNRMPTFIRQGSRLVRTPDWRNPKRIEYERLTLPELKAMLCNLDLEPYTESRKDRS